MSSKRQASEPVHRAQQHVEGVPGQQGGHLVHPPPVEVDFQADDNGKPGILGLLGAAHVRIEVSRGVEIPVVGDRRRSVAGTRSSDQNPSSRASAWRKRKRCSVTASSVTPAAWAFSQ